MYPYETDCSCMTVSSEQKFPLSTTTWRYQWAIVTQSVTQRFEKKMAGFSQWILILSVSLSVGACQLISPGQDSRSNKAETAIPPDPVWVARQQVLFEADQALSRNRLMTPAYDNAYDRYKQVLAEEPGNEQAKQGLAAVAERYVELAQSSYGTGNREQALLYLRRAAKADPKHPQLVVLSKRYQKQPAFVANEFPLSLQALERRDVKVQNILANVARRAREIPSRVLIIARNDEEGRWIYRIMRQAVNGYRLRGNIQQGPVPKVILLDG